MIGVLLGFVVALGYGCKKGTSTIPGQIRMIITYKVDDLPLVFDTIAFRNRAGEQYSVERLTYYLSDFRFYKNNSKIYEIDTILYEDAHDTSTSHPILYVPYNNYDSVAFLIGIDSLHNITGALPPTLQNNEMVWPDPMGGGYHFIRLEGHWRDITGVVGYTIHLGMNSYQVHAGVGHALNVESDAAGMLKMVMNVNEWFSNPHTYSFNADGVYTMGIDSLMQKIRDNGTDVFTAY